MELTNFEPRVKAVLGRVKSYALMALCYAPVGMFWAPYQVPESVQVSMDKNISEIPFLAYSGTESNKSIDPAKVEKTPLTTKK